jgi:putative ABC transport system ATP-binding protein
MLVLKGVSKSYPIAGERRVILDGVNLDIKKGEIVSFTGKSGCGKSTLLNVISGITSPEKGSVYLDGKKMVYFLDIFSSIARNKKIGFIFQTFRLLPEETVWSNVLMPARIKGSLNKGIKDRMERILKELEIFEYKSMKACLLSGGQKQRAAIARALVNDPALILADEPTANLDKETAVEICKILQKVAESGKTILAVTHQEYLFKHSDRIYLLRDGKLEVKK